MSPPSTDSLPVSVEQAQNTVSYVPFSEQDLKDDIQIIRDMDSSQATGVWYGILKDASRIDPSIVSAVQAQKSSEEEAKKSDTETSDSRQTLPGVEEYLVIPASLQDALSQAALFEDKSLSPQVFSALVKTFSKCLTADEARTIAFEAMHREQEELIDFLKTKGKGFEIANDPKERGDMESQDLMRNDKQLYTGQHGLVVGRKMYQELLEDVKKVDAENEIINQRIQDFQRGRRGPKAWQ